MTKSSKSLRPERSGIRRTLVPAAGVVVTLLLLGGSRTAAGQDDVPLPSELPANPLIPCHEAPEVRSEDCAHFNNLSRQMDFKARRIAQDLQDIEYLQSQILESNMYQDATVLGDLTQLMQLRLQTYLDAYTKMFEALSNILGKIAQTQDSMVSHLK